MLRLRRVGLSCPIHGTFVSPSASCVSPRPLRLRQVQEEKACLNSETCQLVESLLGDMFHTSVSLNRGPLRELEAHAVFIYR